MSVVFSPSRAAFLLDDHRKAYEDAGSWPVPDDTRPVTPEVHRQFVHVAHPPGKKIGADAQGNPAWVDDPDYVAIEYTPLPHPFEERIAQLEQMIAKQGELITTLAAAPKANAQGNPTANDPDYVEIEYPPPEERIAQLEQMIAKQGELIATLTATPKE